MVDCGQSAKYDMPSPEPDYGLTTLIFGTLYVVLSFSDTSVPHTVSVIWCQGRKGSYSDNVIRMRTASDVASIDTV
jgi:hypothetical protein